MAEKKLTENQIYMLIVLAGAAEGNRSDRADDAQMMVTFGYQWRRAALRLEADGYIDANRNGWRITKDGRRKAVELR